MKNIGLIIIAGCMIISCNQCPKQNNASEQEKQSVIVVDTEREFEKIHV